MKVFNQNDVFAVYRLPNENDFYLINQKSKEREKFDTSKINEQGFVFIPFDNYLHPKLFIKADTIEINTDFSFTTSISTDQISTSKEKYLEIAEDFINAVHRDFEKLVLSKTKFISHQTIDAAKLFYALKEKYPDAMVFLVNYPEIGTWLGASPEILLKKNEDNCSTIALAGTQYIQKQLSAQWSEKERKEQNDVVNYIIDNLNSLNIEFTVVGPFDRIAMTSDDKKLVHLATEFNFQTKEDIFKLLSLLHPTPAVSGFPKNEAIEYIQKYETHDRKYYTGYLGPSYINKGIEFYVNLRCLEFFSNGSVLYVGGGIVKGSEAEKEWEETENKALTLLNIINLVK